MSTKPTATGRANQARAAAALTAIRAFSETPEGEALTGPSLLTQNIADLLADLAHLCDRERLDLADLLRRARNSYRSESATHPQEFRYAHSAAVQKVAGVTRAARVAEALTRASIWFTAEPMPGDEWEFAVTAEKLSNLIAIIGKVPCNLGAALDAVSAQRWADAHEPDTPSTQDDDQDENNETPNGFTNYYVHCRQTWKDTWTAMCNDDCPECGHEIAPYASQDDDGETTLHVRPDFVPEDGWPEGMSAPADLPGWPV
jgi:hypothetical protein